MIVVLDTNIVVSSHLVSAGPPARILALWRSAAFELLVSEPILHEYQRLLSSPRIVGRHGMSPAQVAEDIDGFREYAIMVEVRESLGVVEDDPDDDKLFDCAVAGGAAYIVSRDEKVLAVKQYRGIRVVSPEVFLALLEVEGGRG